MTKLISNSEIKFSPGSRTRSILLATMSGLVLGLFAFKAAPIVSSLSRYRLVFVVMMVLVYLSTLVARDVRRVLLVSLVLAIPLGLGFSPLGDVVYHAGGAPAGVVVYLYDFPLFGLLVLAVLDTLSMRKPIRFSSVDIVVVLLILWSTLSLGRSSDISLGVFEVLRMLKLYVLARIIANNVRTKQDLHDVTAALLIGLMIQCGIGMVQYATGDDLDLGLFIVGDLRRVSGTIGWPNTYGAYAAVILCVGLTFWLFDLEKHRRLLVRAATIAGIVSLILSFSRGAWISLLVGVVFILMLGWRTKFVSSKTLASLAIIALCVLLVGAFFAESILARLTEVDPGMATITDRLKLNQVAINMIQAHPILGVGINTFVEVMRQYDTTGVTFYFPQPVHNVYLLIAAETGVIGLGLFLLMLSIVFRHGLEAASSSDRYISGFAIAMLGGLVVLLVSNLADNHLRTAVLYPFLWLLIGLISGTRRLRSPGQAHYLDADAQLITSVQQQTIDRASEAI